MIRKLICVLFLVNLNVILADNFKKLKYSQLREAVKCCEAPHLLHRLESYDENKCRVYKKLIETDENPSYIWCVLRENNLTISYRLDYPNVKSFLPKIIEEKKLRSSTKKAFKKCMKKGNWWDGGYSINVVYCVSEDNILKCPKKLWNQNNDEGCDDIRSILLN